MSLKLPADQADAVNRRQFIRVQRRLAARRESMRRFARWLLRGETRVLCDNPILTEGGDL